MKPLMEAPSRIVILGGGRAGAAMLEILSDEPLAEVIAVVDCEKDAPAIVLAEAQGIAVYHSVEEALAVCDPCLAFNLTNDERVEKEASDILGPGAVVGGLQAKLLWRMVIDLKDAKKELEHQASHDPLTGLYNRRYVMKQMQREVSQAIRYKLDYSLVLIDLDHFKQVNDNYGHAVGDFVLKYVAHELQRNVRCGDLLGRWGGEEFIVLLPYTNASDARLAALQWLQKVQKDPVLLPSGEFLNVGFSAGVSELLFEDGLSEKDYIDTLLDTADRYLYKAKDAGRDRVMGSLDG